MPVANVASHSAIGEGGMSKLRVLDLFSGIGGFSLGLERTGGFETVAFCEIEEFPRKVLAKHWPKVPIYNDVRTLTAERLAADGIGVDVICGGFPCQPFSTASHGKRVAIDLWPEMARLVHEIRPRFVIAENVQELPIRRASRTFADIGYRTLTKNIGASDLGADHQRSRWWVCAYPDDQGELYSAIDAEVEMLQAVCRSIWGGANYARAIRVSDGLPHRVDRNKSLGNSIVPIIPQAFGNAILQSMRAA
jgi:DNA (cytosine-5)-methyltransferase 1